MTDPAASARDRRPRSSHRGAAAVHRHQFRGALPLVLAWVVYIAAIWLVAWYAADSLFSHRVPPPPATPVAPLSAWDGVNYAAIARHGYSPEPDALRRFAFFPLLPALARLLGSVSHAPLAGIVLNQLLLLGSLLLLRDWRAQDSGDLRGEPGFWLLVAPLAFFHVVFYAESLFLFLVLLGLVLHRRRRLAPAWLALFLAGLTRPTAICLPALFLPAIRQPQSRRSGLLLAAAPLAGMAVYFGYVGTMTGSPFGYARLQAELWGHDWTLPFLPVVLELKRTIGIAIAGGVPPRDLLIRPVVLLAVAAVLATGWRRLEPEFRAYAIVSLLFIHAQVPSLSTARYDLAIFPVFIALARAPVARSSVGVLLAVALLIVQFVFMLDFMVWRWAG